MNQIRRSSSGYCSLSSFPQCICLSLLSPVYNRRSSRVTSLTVRKHLSQVLMSQNQLKWFLSDVSDAQMMIDQTDQWAIWLVGFHRGVELRGDWWWLTELLLLDNNMLNMLLLNVVTHTHTHSLSAAPFNLSYCISVSVSEQGHLGKKNVIECNIIIQKMHKSLTESGSSMTFMAWVCELKMSKTWCSTNLLSGKGR